MNLSLEQSREGDPPLALATAVRAIELGGGGMAWNNAGLALFTLRRLDEAGAHFTEAARLDPGRALFWSNLGAVRLDQGRLAEAERALREEALGRDPDQPLAHLNLGALTSSRTWPGSGLDPGRLERAVALAAPDQRAKARALLARTREPRARGSKLGDRRLGEGNAAGALGAFDRAGALGAGAADVAVGRSGALLQAGDPRGAAVAAEAGLGPRRTTPASTSTPAWLPVARVTSSWPAVTSSEPPPSAPTGTSPAGTWPTSQAHCRQPTAAPPGPPRLPGPRLPVPCRLGPRAPGSAAQVPWDLRASRPVPTPGQAVTARASRATPRGHGPSPTRGRSP